MSTGRYGGRRGQWPIAGLALAAIAIFAVGTIVSSVWHPIVVSGPYPFFPFGVFWVWPLFAFVFIFFVARWFFWGWGWRGGYGRYNDATGIIEERYAKGEITKEQLEQMRKDLERGTR